GPQVQAFYSNPNVLASTTGTGNPKSTQAQVDALSDAALHGDLAKVQALIKAGVDVNGKDSHLGWTPLMHALTAGEPQIAELLLKSGARVDEPLPDGHTALTLLAKRNGDPAMMELLLNQGADKNHQDTTGKTALKWAAENADKVAVEKLLTAGADPDI